MPETPAEGAPPRSGWARMVVELHVNDLAAGLSFWREALGFGVAFARAEEGFVYLEHPEGHQIMLCQRHGRFETGPMAAPLGQGAMFQIHLAELAPVLDALAARRWPLYLGPREIRRRTGDRESGQREVFVQDPDGYLIMLAQGIGERRRPAARGPRPARRLPAPDMRRRSCGSLDPRRAALNHRRHRLHAGRAPVSPSFSSAGASSGSSPWAFRPGVPRRQPSSRQSQAA